MLEFKNMFTKDKKKLEAVVITPAMAEEMLKNNGHNRKLAPLSIKKLSNAILRGEWKYNGVPIIFSKTNKLLDGQHRLKACVLSGKSIISDIVYNIEDNCFDTIDIGRIRSLADIFYIGGEENGKVLAASLKLIYSYYNNNFSKMLGGTSSLTHQQAEKVLEEHPKIRQSVQFSLDNKKEIKGMLSPTLFSVIHYILNKVDETGAYEFVENLKTGAGLSVGHPILALRKLLFLKSNDKHPRQKFVLMFKAWNYLILNKKISHLKSTANEKMPKLLSPITT